ncbi:K(+) efflux antiporter 3, chloroplastic [Porphyridium purpureum]|uniref:K(+) efflux antiporter 3, chloroplastic n=1 Tax=Porphyridium purpureum TaxID=35688 RepID=A0A5J4Z496_PORPP|nr:K(+) efflux antiporter 3, chloroplastic [Porphyridium purpureum]|eukprot:POR5978..scf295_1
MSVVGTAHDMRDVRPTASAFVLHAGSAAEINAGFGRLGRGSVARLTARPQARRGASARTSKRISKPSWRASYLASVPCCAAAPPENFPQSTHPSSSQKAGSLRRDEGKETSESGGRPSAPSHTHHLIGGKVAAFVSAILLGVVLLRNSDKVGLFSDLRAFTGASGPQLAFGVKSSSVRRLSLRAKVAATSQKRTRVAAQVAGGAQKSSLKQRSSDHGRDALTDEDSGDLVTQTLNDFTHHMSPAVVESLVLLLTTVIIVPLMRRLNTSPILGFLAAGVLLGPPGLKLVGNVSGSRSLAELGVVFFLFEMGLELSISKLRSLGLDVFGLGSMQFVLTSALFTCIGSAAGLALNTALVVGGALALSSSAFVLQLLQERGEVGSRFGRAALGILLLQDLAVVPLLVLTPLLARGGGSAAMVRAMSFAGIKAIVAVLIIVVAGSLLLEPTFRFVAKAQSQEAFIATILLTVLATSKLTEGLGLSDTLGAFLAGIMLAETSYVHQVEADIKPFRGLLLGLFFITVGFSIDIPLLMNNLGAVLALMLGLMLVKAGIIAALGKLVRRMSLASSVRTGLVLAQGGEFAFVLFQLAGRHGLLPPENKLSKMLLVVVALSMACTPALAMAGERVGALLSKKQGLINLRKQDADTAGIQDYVIVAGFGRVGQCICEMLDQRFIPYIAFDLSPARVLESRGKGLNVLFGDATRPEVLATAGVDKAKAVVVTLDDPDGSVRAVRAIKREFPKTTVFCRAFDIKHQKLVQLAGGVAVIPEILEASLLLGGAVLRQYGVPESEVNIIIEQSRTKTFEDAGIEPHDSLYSMLREIVQEQEASAVAQVSETIAAEAPSLTENAASSSVATANLNGGGSSMMDSSKDGATAAGVALASPAALNTQEVGDGARNGDKSIIGDTGDGESSGSSSDDMPQ